MKVAWILNDVQQDELFCFLVSRNALIMAIVALECTVSIVSFASNCYHNQEDACRSLIQYLSALLRIVTKSAQRKSVIRTQNAAPISSASNALPALNHNPIREEDV